MLKNGVYNVAGAVVRLMFNLISVPVLIRVLGVEEYGLWALISAVIGLVALAEAGLSFSTAIFISRDLAIDNDLGVSETLTLTGGAILIFATIAAGAVWLSAPAVIHLFPRLSSAQEVAAIPALRFAGLVVWTRLLQQVLVGVEQAYQRYDLLNLLNTMQAIVLNVGLAAVAWSGGRIVALTQWQLFVGFVLLVMHLYTCWELLGPVGVRLVWSRQKGLEIGHYSIMAWLTALGGTFFMQGDRLAVGMLLGSKALGIYAAITNITSQINTFSALSVQPLMPALSTRMVLEGGSGTPSQSLKLQVKQAFQINGVITLALGSALFAFSLTILHITIPEAASADVVRLFRLAVVIYALYSMNAVGYFVLFAVNDVKTCMVIQFCSGIASLMLIAIGAHYYGLIGAIIGNAAYNIGWLMNYFGMRKLGIGVSQWSKSILFPIVWFAAVVVIDVSIGSSSLFLLSIIFVLQLVVLVSWFVLMNRALLLSIRQGIG